MEELIPIHDLPFSTVPNFPPTLLHRPEVSSSSSSYTLQPLAAAMSLRRTLFFSSPAVSVCRSATHIHLLQGSTFALLMRLCEPLQKFCIQLHLCHDRIRYFGQGSLATSYGSR